MHISDTILHYMAVEAGCQKDQITVYKQVEGFTSRGTTLTYYFFVTDVTTDNTLINTKFQFRINLD